MLAVLIVALTAVGVVSVLLVDRSLRARLTGEALATTEFNLAVLAPAAGISAGSNSDEIAASGVLDRFLDRGPTGVWVEFDDGSRLAQGDTQAPISGDLRRIADRGEIAYQFSETPGGLALVTAARLPGEGPTYFFVTPATTLVDTVRQVALVVGAAGLVALAAGALLAASIARRMLAPVAAARQAAERMRAGDLAVRLEQAGSDEFGRLSGAFNEMAASLQSTIAQLEEARARERRFVADVSHELRTPLTGLTNEAHLLHGRLRTGAEVTGDDVTLAGMLQEDVTRLRHLVEDLLEISRLDSDAVASELGTVDVGALLASIITTRHPDAELVSSLDRPVTADPRSLERIVGNLLDNAARHAPGAPTTVAASLLGDTLVIEVSDRGPGVAPELLPRLSERFTTADTARGSGTGLGLAIADQHARRLGGSLTPVLRAGGGLTFRLEVPVGELLHAGESDETSASDDGAEPQKGTA